MNGKVFLDTNILIYYSRTDCPDKKQAAAKIIKEYDCVISAQVVNEICSVLTKKYPTLEKDIKLFLDDLIDICEVVQTSTDLAFLALKLHFKYKTSYYDSLILAAALESNSSILYSEDLQHGQVIESSLKIMNPFAEI
ncbi:MAG: PIN domain-containing protein [Fibromonadaceae bacterium]|jgi:predicted nucleic acid-binding protein|nr:PIN domain-containing protein [Fibromonadaceae bacterium]